MIYQHLPCLCLNSANENNGSQNVSQMKSLDACSTLTWPEPFLFSRNGMLYCVATTRGNLCRVLAVPSNLDVPCSGSHSWWWFGWPFFNVPYINILWNAVFSWETITLNKLNSGIVFLCTCIQSRSQGKSPGSQGLLLFGKKVQKISTITCQLLLLFSEKDPLFCTWAATWKKVPHFLDLGPLPTQKLVFIQHHVKIKWHALSFRNTWHSLS